MGTIVDTSKSFSVLIQNKMIEAKSTKGSVLKKVVEAVSVNDLIKEASWKFSETGIQIQAMDRSGVLVSLFLPCEIFNEYRCDVPSTLVMKLDSVSKILKGARDDDRITIRAEHPDVVEFIIGFQDGEQFSCYEMKYSYTETIDYGFPDYEETSTCVIYMSAAKFQKICSDLSEIGQSMRIDCRGEGVKFSASGDLGDFYTGDVNLTAGNPGEEDAVGMQMQEACTRTGSVALKCLNFSTVATPLYGSVILSLSPDGPLIIEHKILPEDFKVRYCVLPKFDEEEEAA